jgi:hypothetical protein
MADHEDYLSGEAPMAHHESHESLGSDEISVAGLSGELADDQPAKAHDLGGAKHNADTLANLNAKVSDATLLDDDGINALIGINVAAHAALPTVHQDAPALIATHKADASAHHAKYTDAEARASINDIFGADGKADSNINLDNHDILNVRSVNVGNSYLGYYSIPDDDFMSLTPHHSIGIILINSRYHARPHVNCMVNYKCPATSFAVIMCQSDTKIEVTTGVLDGTTGTNGKVTISPHTDGKIYIENRIGGGIYFGITLLGI